MFGIAACSKYQRDISPFRRRVTFGMTQKLPKGHWGFAQGKHFAVACVFIRCTPKPPMRRTPYYKLSARSAWAQWGMIPEPHRLRARRSKNWSGRAILASRLAILTVPDFACRMRRTLRLSIPRRFLCCGALSGRFQSRAGERPG